MTSKKNKTKRTQDNHPTVNSECVSTGHSAGSNRPGQWRNTYPYLWMGPPNLALAAPTPVYAGHSQA